MNDIFLLSLVIVNLACSLELFITRGGALKRVGRALWCTVKWNFLLILLWLPVLGLFQLPYVDVAFDHVLTALRIIGMTRFAGAVRSDWLWWSSTMIGWLYLVVTFVLYAVIVGWLHHIYAGPAADPANDGSAEYGGLGRWLWSTQWESYLSTVLQVPPHRSWSSHPHGTGTSGAEVGMELLIERLAVPNLWLQPIISSQYIHNLPVWRHRGPCRVDSDVGSDPESSRDHDDGTAGEAATSEDCQGDTSGALDANWTPWFGQQRPLLFVCERCRALQSAAALPCRSEQELEQERLESESACAKYLMDGNYRCMCGLGGGGTGDGNQVSDPSDRSDGNSSSGHVLHGSNRPSFYGQSACRSEQSSSRSQSSHGSRRTPFHGEHARRSDGSPSYSHGEHPCGFYGSSSKGQSLHGSNSTSSPQHRAHRSNRNPSGTLSDKLDHHRLSQNVSCSDEDFGSSGGLPAGIIVMTDCSICLENYRYGALLCGLPCGHSFHQQCIMGWLGRDNHCCPICRWPAYKAKPCNLHQHYD